MYPSCTLGRSCKRCLIAEMMLRDARKRAQPRSVPADNRVLADESIGRRQIGQHNPHVALLISLDT